MPDLLWVTDEGAYVVTAGERKLLISGSIADGLGDGHGGVVLQPETGRAPTAVAWLSAAADAPSVVFDPPGARWVGIEDVFDRAGTPVVTLRVYSEEPNDCADEECRWVHEVESLVAVDLMTGAEVGRWQTGSFESDYRAFRFGGTSLAAVHVPYGSEEPCLSLGSAADVLDAPFGSFLALSDDCLLAPAVDCPEGGTCFGVLRFAVAPDGSALAVALRRTWVSDAGGQGVGPVELIWFDLPAATERARVVVAEPGWWPTAVEFDGSWTLVTIERDSETASLLVGPGAVVRTLDPAGRWRLWPGG